MSLLLTLGGLAVLILAAQALIHGAAVIADRLRLPQIVVGILLVGFGTSVPELSASVSAALAGAPAIALGNVVGSNIANVLLILGATALIRPVPVDRGECAGDARMMLAAAVLLAAAVWLGALGRMTALILLAGLIVYLGRSFARREAPAGPPPVDLTPPVAELQRLDVAVLIAGLGLVGVILGAHWLIAGGVAIATRFGVPESVIGVTLVAVGTSLPELAATLTAAARGRAGVALGNILGSNIFNALGVIGVTALVAPIAAARDIALIDMPIMLAASALLAGIVFRRSSLSRAGGAVLLALYALYAGFRLL